jgi:maltooligosyltrehalose trehalohydrolase
MRAELDHMDLGASYLGDNRCQFLVWAPFAGPRGVFLECHERDPIPMTVGARGYYHLLLEHVAPGTRYRYILNGDKARADPASRFQPGGVHAASAVVDPQFPWTDSSWTNPPLAQYVIYELHIGTFSPAGTLDAIIPRLPYLRKLGITAIELMPVAQFPGSRNWGYDGVSPFAVQNSYGGPNALKNLVNAAHAEGLAVVLDVVYNHLGPEGNYLRDFGPYFTEQYRTPWGDALNFDGPDSDEVRRFFVENALYWVTDCHLDALRLDAIHAIVDFSARPLVQELAAAVQESCAINGRRAYVIAESDRNDVRVVQPKQAGGLGCNALWSDNFHHALHVLLTGERDGYYMDFGAIANLATAYTEGFVYSGQYSQFRRRRHGNSARGVPGQRFVVCAQNHDQIGNRMKGDRLSTLVDFESLKLAAGAVLFSPFLPLLFMGEEYGETAPFLYFTSHGDPALIEAVRRGRQEEFAAFSWQGEVPDPQAEETFLASVLTPRECRSRSQHILLDFHQELLQIRRRTPVLSHLSMDHCRATVINDRTLLIRRWLDSSEVLLLLHFADGDEEISVTCPPGRWDKAICSSDPDWNGAGATPASIDTQGEFQIALAPRSFALYAHL